VQKQVLGKSIGRLLDSTKPVVEPANRADGKLDPDKISSPGLKVLSVQAALHRLIPTTVFTLIIKLNQKLKKNHCKAATPKFHYGF